MEKIRIPSDVILDISSEEIKTNPAIKEIISICKNMFIPVWHNEKIEGVNTIIPGVIFGENPVVVSRLKKGEETITPEEFLSKFSDLDDCEKIDFGSIGMLMLNKEARYFSDELSTEILKSFYNGDWILGEKVKEFERSVCEKLKVKYSVGVNSGTDAILIGLRAIALSKFRKEFFSKEDEIIVPDLTFLATAEAVILSGATPVLANVDDRTYTLSPESLKKSITKNTKGIVVVHLYGLTADMDEIMKIARENNLFVVEDCAQSFYSKFKDEYAGTIGDVGCFSFFPSKNLGGHGDGGLITTNNEDIYYYANILGKHGSKIRDYPEHIGMNSRLDTIQAALLKKKLEKIDFFTQRRREIARIYSEKIEHPNILKPYEPPNRTHVFHQYTIRVKGGASGLKDFLWRNNIETRIYYPFPMHKAPAISRNSKNYDKLYTEDITKEILSLPIEPLYPDILIRYIAGKINSFFADK